MSGQESVPAVTGQEAGIQPGQFSSLAQGRLTTTHTFTARGNLESLINRLAFFWTAGGSQTIRRETHINTQKT